MPWIVEDLLGDKNSINRDFTVNHVPLSPTVSVFHSGRTLRPVAVTPQPGQFQFAISSNAIKVGDAPDSGDALWTRYFYEPE